MSTENNFFYLQHLFAAPITVEHAVPRTNHPPPPSWVPYIYNSKTHYKVIENSSNCCRTLRLKISGTARGYLTFRIPRHVTRSLRVPWTVAGHPGLRFCPQSATAAKTEAHDTKTAASSHSDPEPVAVLRSRWALHVRCHVEDTPGALTQPSLVSTTAKSIVAHTHANP